MTLDSDIRYLPGVGPKRAQALHDIGLVTVWDLLNYFPRRYLDRRTISPIRSLKIGHAATVVGRVSHFGTVKNRSSRGSRFKLVLEDDSGTIELTWFQGARYYEKAFTEGEWLAVFGKVEIFGRSLQMTHPEFDRLDSESDDTFLHTGAIIPVYPSSEELRTKFLDSRGLRKLIKPVLELTDAIEETLPLAVVEKYRLISLGTAYRQIHFPSSPDNLQHAQRRLKFEELFYLQLLLAYRRSKVQSDDRGIRFTDGGEKTERLLRSLPFDLTTAQKKVLQEIYGDMDKPIPMNRMIQGDVGSGKTIVAILAMLRAVENGYQTALMVPTEILAEQHYIVLQELLWGLGVQVALLKGGQKKSERDAVLSGLASHQIDLVVGTHALFQNDVVFQKLGMIVVDEQHRFGVMQRAEIRRKSLERGFHPDVLVMTATPIPRTLAMAIYGDLDVSVIGELPSGRKTIRTAIRTDDARPKVYDFIRSEIGKGRQTYIVYPLIEASEKTDLKAATDAYEHLSKDVFPDRRLGLLHGRLKTEEKQQIMSRFKNREIDILVSTTVIEVGINVPNATIMLIEHAERFGLSQLHQLRGRVGRGSEQSYCILMTDRRVFSDETRARLRIMEETTDGFRIAEEDLKIRGPGELFGTRQSGLPELKMANLVEDRGLMEDARTAAFDTVRQDPQMRDPRHAGMVKKFKSQYLEKLELAHVS